MSTTAPRARGKGPACSSDNGEQENAPRGAGEGAGLVRTQRQEPAGPDPEGGHAAACEAATAEAFCCEQLIKLGRQIERAAQSPRPAAPRPRQRRAAGRPALTLLARR